MYTIAIAPDSFKGNMTAQQAASRIEIGIRRVLPGVRIRTIPMADGGEGTVRAIVDATGGRLVRRTVSDPLGRPVRAEFGLSGDGRTAVIEMAEASGLVRLAPAERNPLLTSTRGTGELIAHALKLGVAKLLVGIGGSATNDGGAGMARALGVAFLDARGEPLPEGGGALAKLDRIDMSGLNPRLAEVAMDVACDVENPLCGPQGAAQVYGPQKGATPEMIERLDAGLRTLADVVQRDLGRAILDLPGAGAAGGLGAGLVAFAGGRLRPGVDIVIDCVRLRRRLRGCNLVITGEGRMDGQTAFGKTPSGVARVARECGIPVIALAGCLGPDASRVHAVGIDAVFATLTESISDVDIPKRGPAMLSDCAEQLARILLLAGVTRRDLSARAQGTRSTRTRKKRRS